MRGEHCVCACSRSQCTTALLMSICFGHHISWYGRFHITNVPNADHQLFDSSVYYCFAISKIQYFVHLQKKKKKKVDTIHTYTWLGWEQSVLLSWCRCDTELRAHKRAPSSKVTKTTSCRVPAESSLLHISRKGYIYIYIDIKTWYYIWH